jgi:hypothetical protein
MMGKKKTAKMRGGGKVKKMNMGGRTGDMMYSRGYGVGERSKRMPTMLKDRGPTGMKSGGAARRNLLEEVGRIDAERMNPNRRAEKKRVIGELNRGFKKGGVAKMRIGGLSKHPAHRDKTSKGEHHKKKPSLPLHSKRSMPSNVIANKIKPKVKPKPKASSIIPKGRHPEKSTGKGITKPGLGKFDTKAKDAAIMKAEKARRARAKKDIPTGRSAAASGYSKRKEIGKKKGYKKHPSKPNLGNR